MSDIEFSLINPEKKRNQGSVRGGVTGPPFLKSRNTLSLERIDYKEVSEISVVLYSTFFQIVSNQIIFFFYTILFTYHQIFCPAD